ncbi:TetR/AcrR family transcriptional regulator [Mycolicibacterium sp. CH28]|uniref:TetR/AcrR family transcriptional regulator n=1 Tax=Mycolicibacterium sp. CH28 TaxID=2512237 RepID=UPI001081D2B7|nr:TetR/AcrR family transcriptional regulator [Mycolicibacterium sp. CH28]TGD89257.1 TetR/AcrR family transcriptional regulator [Mycolicibacterium sp. CH28]
MTQARSYGGVDAADRLARRRARLLEAGLELLGRDVDPAELTVRGICHEAGVATRYFYEGFADKDELVAAVFDWVVTGLATTTQAAVAAARPEEKIRAGMANIVRTIEQDPRIGRLMFGSGLSNTTVVRKRRESGALFAMLSGQHVETTLRRPANDRITAVAHFVVGGVGQTISAWLTGEIRLTPDELVDQLTAILGDLAEPRLFQD